MPIKIPNELPATKTLTEERGIVSNQVSDDFSKVRKVIRKVDGWFNEDPDVEVLPSRKGVFWYTGIGLVYLVAVLLTSLGVWVKETFGIGFGELVATLLSPTKGTGNATVIEIAKVCVPLLAVVVLLYGLIALVCRRRKHFQRAERLLAAGAVISLLASCTYINTI